MVHASCMGLFPHDQVQLQKYHAYCSEQLLQCAFDRRITRQLREMYTGDLQVDLYFKTAKRLLQALLN